MRRKSLSKICPNCGKGFLTYPSQNLTCCSQQCVHQHTHQLAVQKKLRICRICSASFVPKHTKSPGLYCSYKCRGISSRKPFVMRSGYKWIYTPEHPCATKQGYYPEHKLIMEKYLGRILEPFERVHHINHIRDDNRRIENLMLMTVSSHSSYHAKITLSKTPIHYTPYGFCHCGCGQKTNLARDTNPKRGDIKGQSVKYIKGHRLFGNKND